MKFSTKSRYALRLMIDIAQHQQKVSLKEISERQSISLKYLEQIVNPLVKAGLLCSERGIIRIFEGNLMPIPCTEVSPNRCARYSICPTVGFWEGLGKVINDYVDNVTLDDLCKKINKLDLDLFFKQFAEIDENKDCCGDE